MFELKRIKQAEKIEIYKNNLWTKHGLPEIDFENGVSKIIYLFDDIGSPQCAINDEQILESIYTISKTPESDKSLLSYLKNKVLLFLGCDFPDWFMRYCIRVLNNSPLEKSPTYTYIINNHPPKLKYRKFFFDNYGIHLIQSSPVSDLIHNFCEKESSKVEFINHFKGSQIFISYSKDFDQNIAYKIYKYMRNRGIDIYFDEEHKSIDEHKEKIKDYILDKKTKLLISVISKGMIDKIDNSNESYIKEVEWDNAFFRLDYIKRLNSEEKFKVVPYFTDDERLYLQKIPPQINESYRFGEQHGGLDSLYEQIKIFLS